MSFFNSLKNLNRYFNLHNNYRRVVFYSESKNDWPHLKGVIKEVLKDANIYICYISSDENDPGLKYNNCKFNKILIDNQHLLSWLFKNIETEIMIMTMPDLNKFHLKRSKHQVHYICIPHSLVSFHMIYRKGAFDHYDTIFCSGPHHIEEIKAMEKKYNLPKKNLIKYGYGKIDTLIKRKREGMTRSNNIHFLIAPSWGKDCIIENKKIYEIIDTILLKGNKVTLRPHPQTIKYSILIINDILNKYKDEPLFNYDNDLNNEDIYFDSDVMISDWSGAAYEYALSLRKPILFIDTPRKINNFDYKELGIEPFEVRMRTIVGEYFDSNKKYRLEKINCIKDIEINKNVFSLGFSAKIGKKYIVNFLKKKIR